MNNNPFNNERRGFVNDQMPEDPKETAKIEREKREPTTTPPTKQEENTK